MKKKFSFLILALLAVTAFAYKAATKATELVAVEEETTWDFSTLKSVTTSPLYNSDKKGIMLTADTDPAITTEVVYADAAEYITIPETFKGASIAFQGESPIRDDKYCQNGTIHFKAGKAGKIVVSFTDTGSKAANNAVKRYLVVNGEQTEYWTSRENNSTDPEVAYAAQLNVTSGEIDVPAGDVTIAGSSAIRVSKIVFTPTAPTTFTITVADGIQNGSVDVSKSEAAEGEMISVSATPDPGFEVDAITVTGDDQTNIQVTDDQFEMPAQNVTVSATFKATSIEPAGDEEWVLTEPADLLSGDIVVIADTATLIALPNTWEGNKGPAGVAITLNEDRTKITSAVESTTPWTYVEDDGTVKFAKNETDSLYCISDNNGIRVGEGEGTAFVIEANENGSNYLKNVLRTRYIGVYVNNMDWRCYTSVNANIKGTRTAFYKKVQAVVEPQVVNIEISPADGDLGALVAAEKQTITDAGNIVGDITINLTAGASYTTSQSIEAPANVTINGEGATVDASALEAPFIQMVALESPTEWTEATFNVSGVTVKGLKTA
ncbi:MAG: hypothetical protein K6A98_08055, partial [Prevotella sp.]|nr:hypothetical protein [Prevotella sp.]